MHVHRKRPGDTGWPLAVKAGLLVQALLVGVAVAFVGWSDAAAAVAVLAGGLASFVPNLWAARRSFGAVGAPQRQAGAVVAAAVGKLLMMAVLLGLGLMAADPRVVGVIVGAFVGAYIAHVAVTSVVSLLAEQGR